MSVRAFRNDFVSGAKRVEPFTQIRTSLSTGAVVVQTNSHQTAYVRRVNHTSNNWSLIKGILPWRSPTNYQRNAAVMRYNPGNYTKSGFSYQNGILGDQATELSFLQAYLGYTGEKAYVSRADVPIISNEMQRAVTECLLKLQQDKVNVGTLLAEARTSVNMVASAAANIWSLLLDVKRGRLDRVRRKLGRNSVIGTTTANAYLQWKYGWKPLCSDLYGLYQDSLSKIEAPLLVTAVRNISNNYSLDGNTTYYTLDGNVGVKNTCKITARLADSFVANAQGYGLVNPLSLAWEVIPYSFVVDWACPIGNYLEALTARAGLTWVGGYKAQRSEGSSNAVYKGSGISGDKGSIDIDFFKYERIKLTGFPSPVPYVKSPFSTGNVNSALALLRQLF